MMIFAASMATLQMATDFSSLDLANLEELSEKTAGLCLEFGNFFLKSESITVRSL